MPRGSPERTAARREEILSACETLYRTMTFKEITLKEIGTITSFTRTSIYNYFQTKEEIFLALFEREYDRWTDSLNRITERDVLSPRELAEAIAGTLPPRELMLKLLSVNLYDMEENSRLERLVDFKRSYAASIEAMHRILETFCPAWPAEERQSVCLTFFQFMHGIYPYAFHTEKQTEAMTKAGIPPVRTTIYDLALTGLTKLFCHGSV